VIRKKIFAKSREGLWILIVAAVVLEGTAFFQFFYSSSALRAEAERRAKTELRRAELEIEKHTVEMETAARMLAMLAEKHVDTPDSIFAATHSVVGAIANAGSLAIAYVPDYFPQHGRYFEACSSRISEDSIHTRQIGSAAHDYTQMEWYQNGLRIDSCWWSEPYLDDSGSQAWVVSCSYPVHKKNQVVAVVCVDLSLEYLRDLSEYLQMYPGSYYSIRSSKGLDIVAQPDTIAGRNYEIFDEEIDATGWHISIIIPDDVIYAELKRVSLIINILMLLGLAVLVFIMYRATMSVMRVFSLSNRQERMENELNIARNIQMAMLPTRFPPFPDYPNLNAYGVVIPAKEVSGDLFDFYIRENRLFFCIGDVSGKGMPAALVMAVTRSLFRSSSSYQDSPAQIVSRMNSSLIDEGNVQDMFVTLFVGVLDLSSGNLHYCNAGHNAPIVAKDEKSSMQSVCCLPCKSNLPLGVMDGFEFEEQTVQLAINEVLFLYTDGLTEAENDRHEFFGEQRLMQLARQWDAGMTASERTTAVQAAVSAFVGNARQTDDLTMFVVRLLAVCQPQATGSLESDSLYSLTLSNNVLQLPKLAEWVDSLGLPEALTTNVNLALEEAVSNVMLYAYPENETGQVLVEAEKSADHVSFTITDTGKPFDPTAWAEPDFTLSAEERPLGGLGIHLVRHIMDETRYQRKDNKNILTLMKRMPLTN